MAFRFHRKYLFAYARILEWVLGLKKMNSSWISPTWLFLSYSFKNTNLSLVQVLHIPWNHYSQGMEVPLILFNPACRLRVLFNGSCASDFIFLRPCLWQIVELDNGAYRVAISSICLRAISGGNGSFPELELVSFNERQRGNYWLVGKWRRQARGYPVFFSTLSVDWSLHSSSRIGFLLVFLHPVKRRDTSADAVMHGVALPKLDRRNSSLERFFLSTGEDDGTWTITNPTRPVSKGDTRMKHDRRPAAFNASVIFERNIHDLRWNITRSLYGILLQVRGEAQVTSLGRWP